MRQGDRGSRGGNCKILGSNTAKVSYLEKHVCAVFQFPEEVFKGDIVGNLCRRAVSRFVAQIPQVVKAGAVGADLWHEVLEAGDVAIGENEDIFGRVPVRFFALSPPKAVSADEVVNLVAPVEPPRLKIGRNGSEAELDGKFDFDQVFGHVIEAKETRLEPQEALTLYVVVTRGHFVVA